MAPGTVHLVQATGRESLSLQRMRDALLVEAPPGIRAQLFFASGYNSVRCEVTNEFFVNVP